MRYLFFLLILVLLLPRSLYADDFKTAEEFGTFAVLPVFAGVMTMLQADKEGCTEITKSFFSAETITFGLKCLINEKRPNGEGQSFPSAHTASAFSAAAFVQQRYGWRYGIPFYLVAILIGADRITSNQHYPQDVLAGAAIGIGTSLLFTHKLDKSKIAIYPLFNRPTSLVISLAW